MTQAVAVGPPASARQRLRNIAPVLSGSALILVVWEIVGRFELLGRGWPPLSEVVGLLLDPSRSRVIWRGLPVTGYAALRGLILGTAMGIALGIACVLARPLREGIGRFVTAVNTIPVIAFAPMLIVTVGRDLAPVYSALLVSLYPVWIAVTSALLNAPDVFGDFTVSLGATRGRAFRSVFLPNAYPALVDGIKLAAPGAFVGAIIGEWFGAPRGLGVVIVASVLNNQTVQLWAAAMLGAVLSLMAYAATSGWHRYIIRRRML